MIESISDSESGIERLILRPNASATRREAALFFSLVAFLSLAIATAFAVSGAWMVLPFSGGELAFLGGCLWWSLRDASVREVITITEAAVSIERQGGRGRREKIEFPRFWARVTLVASPFRGHPSRLSIRSHGKEIEVGRFLVEEERVSLALKLKQTLV